MMRQNQKISVYFMAAALGLLQVSTVFAGDKGEVKEALEKLSKASNYSWVETSETQSSLPWGGQGAPTVVEGKTDSEGAVVLVTKHEDGDIQSVAKNGKAAVKTKDGWKSVEELTQHRGGGGGGFGGGGGGRGRNRDPAVGVAWRTRFFRSPEVVAKDLLEKVGELKSEGDGIYVGILDEEAIQSLAFGGRRWGRGSGRQGSGGGGGGFDVKFSDSEGSVKFWLKKGLITKFEFKVQTTLNTEMGDFEMGRTSLVEIKNVGRSKVKISSAAKKKMNEG